MWTTNVHRARSAVAWAALACAALLVTACSSSASSATSSASSTAGTPAAPATSAPATTPAAPAASAAASSPGSVSVPASATASATAASTFIAEGQDVNGTALHEPGCAGSGCPLSGDGTTILYRMTWTTWSATEAVGTGTYKVDACQPNCAAGPVYPVPAVMTFSQPVKVCSSSGTRWFWSHVSFSFPSGLPKALQGGNAPQNPWTFTALIAAAQQSCS